VRATINVPKHMIDKERVQLEFDPGFVSTIYSCYWREEISEDGKRKHSCEAMIWSKDGRPLQGITGGFGGDRRVEHVLGASAKGSTYQVKFYAPLLTLF
jgi:alpha-mannosidase